MKTIKNLIFLIRKSKLTIIEADMQVPKYTFELSELNEKSQFPFGKYIDEEKRSYNTHLIKTNNYSKR